VQAEIAHFLQVDELVWFPVMDSVDTLLFLPSEGAFSARIPVPYSSDHTRAWRIVSLNTSHRWCNDEESFVHF
jgi:hypothetical protein